MKYEIHVTVETTDIDRFKHDCGLFDLKPIVIETENAGVFNEQVMTSSKYDDDDYMHTLFLITSALKVHGYSILREKIEIFPALKKHPDFLYYETHMRLKLPKNFDRSILARLCSDNDFHMSKNLFKRSVDFDYQMITFRTTQLNLWPFLDVIGMMEKRLSSLRLEWDKVECEECIYDSNISVDDTWLFANDSVYL